MSQPPSSRPTWVRVALIGAFAGVGLLRLYYCTLLPRSTGDLPRHMLYGLYVARDGLAAAGKSLTELSSLLSGIAWADLPYNYPVVALHFFTAVAAVRPTLFFAKLGLTVLEAVNGALIYESSKQPWLALLYWASPASIWWVSGEGQFEPLQSLFVLLALYALHRDARLSLVALALAIQVKLTSVVLLPFVLVTLLCECSRRQVAISVVAFTAALLPSAYAQVRYPMVHDVLASVGSERYNPYHWNMLDRSLSVWNSPALLGANAVGTYGALALLLVFAARSRRMLPYLAPLLFLLFCKSSSLCQPWYMLSFMPLCMAITEPRQRLALFAWAPLLDVLALLQLLFGPMGFTAGANYYGTTTAFTRWFLPPH